MVLLGFGQGMSRLATTSGAPFLHVLPQVLLRPLLLRQVLGTRLEFPSPRLVPQHGSRPHVGFVCRRDVVGLATRHLGCPARSLGVHEPLHSASPPLPLLARPARPARPVLCFPQQPRSRHQPRQHSVHLPGLVLLQRQRHWLLRLAVSKKSTEKCGPSCSHAISTHGAPDTDGQTFWFNTWKGSNTLASSHVRLAGSQDTRSMLSCPFFVAPTTQTGLSALHCMACS